MAGVGVGRAGGGQTGRETPSIPVRAQLGAALRGSQGLRLGLGRGLSRSCCLRCGVCLVLVVVSARSCGASAVIAFALARALVVLAVLAFVLVCGACLALAALLFLRPPVRYSHTFVVVVLEPTTTSS